MINTWELWAIIFGAFDIFLIYLIFTHRKKKIRPKLIFSEYKYPFLNKKLNNMAIISTLTLTNRTIQTLLLSVVDENDNNAVIPGTFSGLSVVSGDISQDTAAPSNPDPNANSVDIAGVSAVGGTTVTATLNFVSTANKADSTPEVSGPLTATLTVVNDIVVKAALVFNQ